MFAAASGRVRFGCWSWIVLYVRFFYFYIIYKDRASALRSVCVGFALAVGSKGWRAQGSERRVCVGFASGMRSGYAKVMVSLFSGPSGSHFLKSL